MRPEALGFAAALPAVQSLLTQGSEPSEVGRVQGLFATSQTACTAVAAAAAGAAFAVASWLPFVTVASIVFVGLVVVAVIWRRCRDGWPVRSRPRRPGLLSGQGSGRRRPPVSRRSRSGVSADVQ